MALNDKSIAAAFSRWKPRSEELAVDKGKPLSLDSPDTCPYCQKKMRPTTAVGVNVFICEDDRHVSPAANAEPEGA
jgi:hypothetical protein